MENGPFEDVFPMKNCDIPASYVIVYQAGYGGWQLVGILYTPLKTNIYHLGKRKIIDSNVPNGREYVIVPRRVLPGQT